MKKDDEYWSIVEKFKKSKSKEERKEFIKNVDRIKECEKNLKNLNHKRDKASQDLANDVVELLESIIKDSK